MKTPVGHSAWLCSLTILSLGMASSMAAADQVIFVDVAHFIPAQSQFEVEVDGNQWIRVRDAGALGGTAFGDPGDNDRDNANPPGAPFLVIKFPEDVRPGESTADGKEWIPWARMRVKTDKNSFFWQVSSDGQTWKPAANTNANRWNNDDRNAGGPLGDGEWYWQDNVTGNAGGIPADISIGENYFRLGVRESGPDDFPEIDVACFRNDGQEPTDAEALASGVAVEPAGKLTTLWARLRQR